MGVSGCVKRCTPTEVVHTTERVRQKDVDKIKVQPCQCDMLKRIECFKTAEAPEGPSDMRCGQFKELLLVYALDTAKDAPKAEDACGQYCARQLAAF